MYNVIGRGNWYFKSIYRTITAELTLYYIYKLLLTTNFFPEIRKASKVNQTLLVSKPTNFTRSMPFPQPMSKNVEDFVIFSLLFIHLTILVMLLSPNLLKKGTVPKRKNI